MANLIVEKQICTVCVARAIVFSDIAALKVLLSKGVLKEDLIWFPSHYFKKGGFYFKSEQQKSLRDYLSNANSPSETNNCDHIKPYKSC